LFFFPLPSFLRSFCISLLLSLSLPSLVSSVFLSLYVYTPRYIIPPSLHSTWENRELLTISVVLCSL
jgi:hypothetical protein